MSELELPNEPGLYTIDKPGWEQIAPYTLTEYGQWFQLGIPVDPRTTSIPFTRLVRLVRADGK